MKYGLDSALPINAFSPRAKGPFARGMTLEGGGGGGGFGFAGRFARKAAEAASNAAQSVGGVLASVDPGPALGDAASSVGSAIDSAAQSTGKFFADIDPGVKIGDIGRSVGSGLSEAGLAVGDLLSNGEKYIGKTLDSTGQWVDVTVNKFGHTIIHTLHSGYDGTGRAAQNLGQVGVHLDKAVNDNVPGGWKTVAGLAATAAIPFVAPDFLAPMADVAKAAATGALKGAAAGGVKSVLQGDSILEGAMSGGMSGALGGAVLGINQGLDFNPFVEQAAANVAKAAASPQGLEKSLDKIAFNALAGYAGSELGVSPNVAVPVANVVRAAAEGKDVSDLLQKQALNYAVGQVAGPVKEAMGGVADQIKDAVGFGGFGGGGGEATAPEDLTDLDKAINFAQNATEVAVKDYLKDQINAPPPRPVKPPIKPASPGLSAQLLMDQGYSWDPVRQVWKRPITKTAAPVVANTAQPTSTPNPFQYADTASDLSNEYTPPKNNALAEYVDTYVDPYAAFDAPKSTSPNAPFNISETGVTYDEPDMDYAEDKSLAEYVDPSLKKKETTNLVAGGLPVQTAFAEGGTTGTDTEKENNEFIDKATKEIFQYIRPGVSHGNANYNLPGYPFGQLFRVGMAQGGAVEGHNPQFFSEGGLNSLGNTFVKGDGDGTSDSIPAMLANGEFVIPADVVSGLGNGSNDSGAKVLDEFLKTIRKHKQKTGADKLPPDSKGPLGYLLEAKRKMKA